MTGANAHASRNLRIRVPWLEINDWHECLVTVESVSLFPAAYVSILVDFHDDPAIVDGSITYVMHVSTGDHLASDDGLLRLEWWINVPGDGWHTEVWGSDVSSDDSSIDDLTDAVLDANESQILESFVHYRGLPFVFDT